MKAPEHRVLWLADICRRYGRDRTTIWRWVNSGNMPTPNVTIANRIGWYESALVAWERSTAQTSPTAETVRA